jgi:LuxR family transcriptional regulator, maltose regulon positive regulatory protein
MGELQVARGLKKRRKGSRSVVSFGDRYEWAHPSSELLTRQRLTQTLMESRKPLVLLAAPPGFGKTTLLHQWRALDERPFAWVSIDSTNDDPVLFWTRIVEALRVVEPSLESAAQIALHAPQADVLHAVIPLLSHDLRFVGREFVLVLDDYQNVEHRLCHESLGLFLHWMPSNVTLVLSTRADPPMHLASLRARGELLEQRAFDLCFTEEEEAAFLNESLKLELGPETLAQLHERTEGWPAGVYLASLSLRSTDKPEGFVAGFSGSNRHVADYLTEVVLDSLDRRQRQFLLETSILDSVCAPLGESVTGESSSAELLEELERANLFLVPLDDQREWYRYHQLFTELLRAQLIRHNDARVPTLHLRAFEWYRDFGYTDEAIRHAVAAGAVEAAVDLAAERWAPRLDCAEARTTLRWLDALPAEAVASDARVLLAKAWAASLTNLHEEGLHALQAAAGVGLDGTFPDGSSLEASAAMIEACFPRGNAGAMLAAAQRGRELESGLSSDSHPLALLSLGWAQYLAGDWAEAGASLQEAAASAAELNQWTHVCIANALLAQLALVAGDNELADARASDLQAVLASHDVVDPLASGMADVALGAVLARSNVGEAEQVLDRGLLQLRAYGEPLLVAEALLVLAPVRRGVRGTEAGRGCIAEARDILEGCADAGILGDRLEQVARSLTPAYRRIDGDSELTEREREVLRYLAEGMPKRDIGGILFLSYNTIHSHTKSIYQKLRVSSRQAAVERARELGAL